MFSKYRTRSRKSSVRNRSDFRSDGNAERKFARARKTRHPVFLPEVKGRRAGLYLISPKDKKGKVNDFKIGLTWI